VKRPAPFPRRWRRLALPLLCLALLPLAGCEQDAGSIGQDSAYLNSPLTGDEPKDDRKDMLPLRTGNWWAMFATCVFEKDGKRQVEENDDRYVVVGPVTDMDVSGIQIDQMRKGKRWRREIFQRKGDTIYISAMQDETSGLMRYHPPIPVLKEPVTEGDYLQWYGEFRMKTGGKDESLPARALSRISGKETFTTSAGKFKAYRVDTIVVVMKDGKEIKFPTVRWLSARVGYVRRGYADKGRPAFCEVRQFNVQ
jgi:hypothetical protein